MKALSTKRHADASGRWTDDAGRAGAHHEAGLCDCGDRRAGLAHAAQSGEIEKRAAIESGLRPRGKKKGKFFRKGQWRFCHTGRHHFFSLCEDGGKEHIRQEFGECSCRNHECEPCREARVHEIRAGRVVLRRRRGDIAVAEWRPSGAKSAEDPN